MVSYDEMLRLVATIPLKLCRPARTFLNRGRPSDGGLFGNRLGDQDYGSMIMRAKKSRWDVMHM